MNWKMYFTGILSFCLLIAGVYFLGYTKGHDIGFTKSFDDTYKKFVENSEMKEVDFKNTVLNIDSRRLVELLVKSVESNDDSLEYKFSNILYEVHSELLNEYLDELNISDSVSNVFMRTYDSIHVGLSYQYFSNFEDNLTKNLGVPDRFVIEDQSSVIADEFTVTIAYGLCDLILTVVSLVAMKERIAYKAFTKDIIFAGFCSKISQEMLPLLKQSFRSAGIYNDMHKLEMLFGEHKRENIAELATIEDIVPNISVVKKQKGEDWYQTDAIIKLTGTSRIKAGVNLYDNFAYEVDRDLQKLIIHVESPKILSVEVNTVTNEVNDGWFNNVEGSVIDEAKNDIEIRTRKISIENGILENSKENFGRIFESIFLPVLQLKRIEEIEFRYEDKNYFVNRLKG